MKRFVGIIIVLAVLAVALTGSLAFLFFSPQNSETLGQTEYSSVVQVNNDAHLTSYFAATIATPIATLTSGDDSVELNYPEKNDLSFMIPPPAHHFGGSSRPQETMEFPSNDRRAGENNNNGNGNNGDGGQGNGGGGNNNNGGGNGSGNGGNGQGNNDTGTLLFTPPNYKVAFIGDSANGENFRRVLQLIRNEQTDVVLHQGDLGYDESPQSWITVVNSVLGVDYPYFFSIGNHDENNWLEPNGYRDILQLRLDAAGVHYQGNANQLGARTTIQYNGLTIVLSGPGIDERIAGQNPSSFIDEQLNNSSSLWNICSWHKNMRAMQVGGKSDETGWEVYETCREHGAIIATAHEHSYGRTQVLSDMSQQVIADDVSPYIIQPGQTFAFHSGLGGQSIRNQRSDIDQLPYFARVYTTNQHANYGALFIEFNVDGDPRKAHGYFKNIDNVIVDEFELHNETLNPETGNHDELVGFVTSNGQELQLNGEPYRFIGTNVYGAANSTIYACGPAAHHGDNPDEYLQAMFSILSDNGVNAVRFWAFQSFTNGGTDFSSFDRVIRYARQYHVKLIPVFENHWIDCSEGGEKPSSWYVDGYRHPYGNYALSYRDYVQQVVEHYKEEPTILMWQMMNEAESSDTEGLYNFATDISGLIHAIDIHHLVSLGTLGTGQAGTANENYVRLHRLSTIDVVEAHDYGHETEAWPSGINSLAFDVAVANQLHKPFFIGESGINAGGNNGRTLPQRADLFDAKINASFSRGVDGYLIWEWDNSTENFGEGCDSGYCFTEGDPLLDVFQRHS